MIAKIIPPAARWAMHAASDPQPNAADSAIEKKRENSAIEKREKIAQLKKRKNSAIKKERK